MRLHCVLWTIWCIITKWTSPSAAAKKVIICLLPFVPTIENDWVWISCKAISSEMIRFKVAQTKTIDHWMAANECVYAIHLPLKIHAILVKYSEIIFKRPHFVAKTENVWKTCVCSVNASMCAEWAKEKSLSGFGCVDGTHPKIGLLLLLLLLQLRHSMWTTYFIWIQCYHPGYCVYIETVHLCALPANFVEWKQFFWDFHILLVSCNRLEEQMQDVIGQSRHKPKPTWRASAEILAKHSEKSVARWKLWWKPKSSQITRHIRAIARNGSHIASIEINAIHLIFMAIFRVYPNSSCRRRNSIMIFGLSSCS